MCALCGREPFTTQEGEWVCQACMGERYTVEFLADYPGGLVPFPDKPIPKGTRIVLRAREAGELKRRFGFVRVERLRPGG